MIFNASQWRVFLTAVVKLDPYGAQETNSGEGGRAKVGSSEVVAEEECADQESGIAIPSVLAPDSSGAAFSARSVKGRREETAWVSSCHPHPAADPAALAGCVVGVNLLLPHPGAN